MKINWSSIEWGELVKAVIKAAWPFLAGAVGGLCTGCSIWGSGVGLTV